MKIKLFPVIQNLITNKQEYYGCISVYYDDNNGLNIKNISHIISNISIENNYYVGEFKILNTYQGNELKELDSAGFKFKFIPIIVNNTLLDININFNFKQDKLLIERTNKINKLNKLIKEKYDNQ